MSWRYKLAKRFFWQVILIPLYMSRTTIENRMHSVACKNDIIWRRSVIVWSIVYFSRDIRPTRLIISGYENHKSSSPGIWLPFLHNLMMFCDWLDCAFCLCSPVNTFVVKPSDACHFPDVTWIFWCLKLPTSQLFIQRLVHANIEENIEATHNCPLLGGNPPTTGSFHHKGLVTRTSLCHKSRTAVSRYYCAWKLLYWNLYDDNCDQTLGDAY